MRKNLFKTIAAFASVTMLTGCSININIPTDNLTVDPINVESPKPTPTPEAIEDDNTDGNIESDDDAPVDIPKTFYVTREIVCNTEEAKESALFTGCDIDGNEIWTYQTEEVYVGQYEDITYCDARDNGAYFVCGDTLYCIDTTTKNYGNVKWKSEEQYAGGSSFVFDDDGNIYVMGYEKSGYVVVDKDGKTINKVADLKFADEEDKYNCFWKQLYDYEDGYIIVYFDSISDIKYFDAKTGEELTADYDVSWLTIDWQVNSWSIEDDHNYPGEKKDDYDISIDKDLNVTFTYKDGSGKTHTLKNMPATVKVGDMYYGIENYYRGKWYLECEYDEENSFMISLTEPYYMEVIWYHGPWTDEVYPAVVSVIFEDAETMQYYSDVLALQNAEKN